MIIAIFKSGKTYIPIDISMPVERQKLILDQLNDSIIFTEKEHKKFFMEYGFNYMDVRKWIKNCENQNSENINKAVLDSAAYILFTSGSTGIPKGVIVEHRNISCLHESFKNTFDFSSDYKSILFHSYGFDYSIHEIVASLTFGGELVIVPEEIRKFTDEFRKFLIDEKINMLTQTPSAFINLIKVEANQNTHPFNNMKYIFIAGEPINFAQLEPWTDIYGFSFPKIYNMYGVTETAVASTYHKIVPEDILNKRSNIIGRALLGTDLFVGDKYGNMIPNGFEGELYISGESVGKGYFNNEIQNNKRFHVKNIINPNSRIFKTGDLVKVNNQNELIYLNRIDSQVQISGHRVETCEISRIISSYSKCFDSIVIAHKFANNDIRLIGYYIVKNNMNCTQEELLDYLKQKLQPYMIPSFLIEIDKKPMTVNGKADLKKLPIPNMKLDNSYSKQEKNLSSEIKVLNIWKKILKNNNITVEDNFFDVGGTSVLIAQVYYDILSEFNLTQKQIKMIDLFDFSNPKQIGKFVDELKDA